MTFVKRDYCQNGHPFAGENLYVDPSGIRSCRTCARNTRRKYLARRRALVALTSGSVTAHLVMKSTTACCEVCQGKGIVQQVAVCTPGRRIYKCKPVRVACPHCKGGVPLLVTG